ncbi:MAG: hypothetical protein R3A47_10740 [Polyangiales bacterium]
MAAPKFGTWHLVESAALFDSFRFSGFDRDLDQATERFLNVGVETLSLLLVSITCVGVTRTDDVSYGEKAIRKPKSASG